MATESTIGFPGRFAGRSNDRSSVLQEEETPDSTASDAEISGTAVDREMR
jgi:hypothetical protein